MKIATTTDDLGRFFNRPTDVCEILPLLKQCGFKYIDLSLYTVFFEGSPIISDEWEKWTDDVGNTAAKSGISFVQAHSSNSVYQKGEERDYKTSVIKRELEICRRLGIPGTVVHPLLTDGGSKEDFLEVNGEFYRELLEKSEKTGVAVYSENTCRKNSAYCYTYTAEDYFDLKKAVGGHPLFGYCWDIGHAHIEGVDQYKEMTALGSELKAVHIADNNGSGDTHIMPYLGTVNMDEIMCALIDSGFKGSFTLEACSSLRPAHFWQGDRKGFGGETRLLEAPLELGLKMEEAMYICAKHILTEYNCFED